MKKIHILYINDDAIAVWYYCLNEYNFSSVQFSSVSQSCPTLHDPMNCSVPGLPVYHQLPEFTQTHVHQVSDAIQPSHPLSSPSPPAPNPSQHQSLFQWVNSSHEVAKYYVTSKTTNITNIIGIKIPWVTWVLRISRVALLNNDGIITLLE